MPQHPPHPGPRQPKPPRGTANTLSGRKSHTRASVSRPQAPLTPTITSHDFRRLTGVMLCAPEVFTLCQPPSRPRLVTAAARPTSHWKHAPCCRAVVGWADKNTWPPAPACDRTVQRVTVAELRGGRWRPGPWSWRRGRRAWCGGRRFGPDRSQGGARKNPGITSACACHGEVEEALASQLAGRQSTEV